MQAHFTRGTVWDFTSCPPKTGCCTVSQLPSLLSPFTPSALLSHPSHHYYHTTTFLLLPLSFLHVPAISAFFSATYHPLPLWHFAHLYNLLLHLRCALVAVLGEITQTVAAVSACWRENQQPACLRRHCVWTILCVSRLHAVLHATCAPTLSLIKQLCPFCIQ